MPNTSQVYLVYLHINTSLGVNLELCREYRYLLGKRCRKLYGKILQLMFLSVCCVWLSYTVKRLSEILFQNQ